ncbi:hypothetical protein PybrP1_008506 [[Pythium] brassicae (nom. inval.)]|nr:hypothetical protein PybrP1_008506 [[Pythium] brassicae (nom. inval.)]
MASSLYAAVAPHFTQDLLTPELKIAVHDEGGSWPFVAASLAQRLPLRGIEWRNLVGATQRIECLPLSFVEQPPLQPQPSASSSQPPLVALYLVKCEDLEHYRAGAKARLAAWVERMNAVRVEWMVLYVPLGTRARAGGGGANHSVYKKIFDKIRADFAHKRPSRICKIEILEGNSVVGGAPGQQQQHESQWSELLLRLRHCIMDAFQVKCYKYEEAVRVLDAKRATSAADWDFGAFFLAKERLALMYQQTYLLDDAIRHFDELDAIVMNLHDSGSWGSRGDAAQSQYAIRASDPIFTTAPLAVDLTATQREIAANRASPLVVQLHCFCRQIRALFLMGSFPQLIERATAFIASFARRLEQLHAATGAVEAHQPHQWAVGACLEIAYACELSWSGHAYQVSSASVPVLATQAISPEAMSRHLGDILYLARRILVRFSKSVASLPVAHERRASIDRPGDAGDGGDTESPGAWYQWLARVFAARSAGARLERCVWEVSHLASLHFSRAGRHRFAVFLGAECARYHVRRREFESASRLFRSHSRQCEEDKWWTLVGDCVRNICSAELELGRAAEAVAACFSMLAATEDAKAEIGREYLETMMHTLVQRLDQRASATELSMGDLIKPSVALETMQTSGSDLEYGEVRVTVRVTNCFPAGVNLEQLLVRFSKRKTLAADNDSDSSSSSDSDEGSTDSAARRLLLKQRAASIGSLATELPRLHSLVLGEDGSPRERRNDDSGRDSGVDQVRDAPQSEDVGSVPLAVSVTGIAGDALGPGTDPMLAPTVDADVQLVDEDARDDDDDSDSAELVLLESNVFLCEKASVDLEFFQSGLGVGSYVCSGVDCVLAGNTFNLVPGAALALGFEIPRRESTLRVAIAGPPLLMPHSVEVVCVTISAENDTVADGVLEVSCLGERVAVQLLRAELQTASSSCVVVSTRGDVESEPRDKLLLSIPSMAPGETLVYRVWLTVRDVDERASDDDNDDNDNDAVAPTSTVAATLRYQHTTPADTSVALRRADATFPTLRPLADRVRLQRVAGKVVAAVALTCNRACGLVLRDYRLAAADNSSNSNSSLSVLHDPNARLRNTQLQPGDTLHFAFTLADTSGCLPDEARLALALEYDAAVGAEADDSDGDASHTPTRWETTLTVRLPLASVRGTRYRIDVEPKRAGHVGLEVAVGEEVAFHVVVRAFSDSSAREAHEVVLCLDERSERDWILLGKARERLSFPQSDAFATLRRLVATRVGRVRFPSFHLRALEGSQAAEKRIAAARVECPHAAMQVTVV